MWTVFTFLILLLLNPDISKCFDHSESWMTTCKFEGTNNFSLNWKIGEEFNLTFTYSQANFPVEGHHWTALVFGNLNEGESNRNNPKENTIANAIIFEGDNGLVFVSAATLIGSELKKLHPNILSLRRKAFLNNGGMDVVFTLPLTNKTSIQPASCNIWMFFTEPLEVNDLNTFELPIVMTSRQVCNIATVCRINSSDNEVPSKVLRRFSQNPSAYTVSPYSNDDSNDFILTTADYPDDFLSHDISAYYSTTTPPNTIIPLEAPPQVVVRFYPNDDIPNSNYQYLNGERFIENDAVDSTFTSTISPYDEFTDPPVRTNAEQNYINYQQIRKGYQINPSSSINPQQNTNIYGYDYSNPYATGIYPKNYGNSGNNDYNYNRGNYSNAGKSSNTGQTPVPSRGGSLGTIVVNDAPNQPNIQPMPYSSSYYRATLIN